MGKTLFDKIWDAHVVNDIEGGPSQLYIDRHYCHEVTSPQAFEGLRKRGLKVFRPEKTYCSPDHNIPTLNQDRPIADPVSRNQVETLTRNAQEFGVTLYGLGHPKNGIIHVIGKRPHPAGLHHSLRRQPHLDPRSIRSRGLRHRHERG